eukprot:TRINITY_DN19174_c0_g2_i7.p2 TRINITY_DN19174_c0_g2~~TRINITY_DN19174_c0_g2_i7.p2  ORF type:complete len:189 (+),score=57.25 TRINITY_DN19174_c0_g2_i7:656-1222(+)
MENLEGRQSDDRLSALSEPLTKAQPPLTEQAAAPPFSLGVIFALVVGITGGTALIPLHYAADEYIGLVFVPSLGIGCLLVLLAPPFYFTANGTISDMGFEDLKLKQCLLPGLCSGLIWNLGNVASIFAIARVGYAVAYPIFQCALLVSSLWGVFVFKEIKSKQAISVLFGSGLVLISGAIVLGLSVGK